MKILGGINKVIFQGVTDEPGMSTCRRVEAGVWEYLRGDTWEPVYDDEELEEAYQAYLTRQATP